MEKLNSGAVILLATVVLYSLVMSLTRYLFGVGLAIITRGVMPARGLFGIAICFCYSAFIRILPNFCLLSEAIALIDSD